MTKVLFRIAVATAFAMAATSVLAGTDWQGTPEWKFADALTIYGLKCNGAAGRAFMSRSVPALSDQAAQEASACLRDSYAGADEKFPVVMGAERSADVKPLLKDMYAKWLVYMGSITSTAPQNQEAYQAFQGTVSTLRVELQSR